MRLPRLRVDGRFLAAFLVLALLLFLFLRLAWEMTEGRAVGLWCTANMKVGFR